MPQCRLHPVNLGWFLTFASDTKAGLVFFSQTELLDFVTSCGIDLAESLDFNPELIRECPQYWLDRARIFQPPF
jgi:hypothetical protein